MKNSYFAIALIIMCSCKKNNTQENQPIDTASLNQMIINYSTPVQGQINIEIYEQVNLDGGVYERNNLTGEIYDRDSVSNTTKFIRTRKLNVNNREFLPRTEYFLYGIENNAIDQQFVKSLFGNKVIPVQLYDTTNALITEFNFQTPEHLLCKTSKYEVTPANWETEKITWNADATNKIGIVLEYQSASNPLNHGVVFLADDGEESIKNVVGDLTGDIDLKMYRGTILIKTGTDGKKYNVTCVAKSYTNVNVVK